MDLGRKEHYNPPAQAQEGAGNAKDEEIRIVLGNVDGSSQGECVDRTVGG